MKLPRDQSGQDLAKALRKLGYGITRQTSSHIRLTTQRQGEHHVTIPDHDSLRVGTLGGLLAAIGRHHKLSRDQLTRLLFGRR
jgi:predicted RNA binding protein YcfA (HicA-like mRNA interferase family)